MSESTADRNPFEQLAEEFAERLRRGEHPSLTEYIARYPEHADDIRELFPALALVEQHKPEGNAEGIRPATKAQPLPSALPDRLGDYRILRYLGEGGMGVVYEAVRESLRSHVALKVIHPQFRHRESYLRRFRTEARSAARLHHTNVVSVFDYGVHDGVCYYAMQYIIGHSLDRVLADVRKLRREKAGFADASDTLALSEDDESALAEKGVPGGAGPGAAGLVRETATLGLVTGRYASVSHVAVPADSDASPSPDELTATGEEVAGTGEFQLWAERLAHATGTAHREAVGRSETQSRWFAEQKFQTQSMSTCTGKLPPQLWDADYPDHPAPNQSASALAGQSNDRYYREVARLGSQIADALAYAHQRSVLHRDIKPPNLILDALGNIWITDFGLAKFDDGGDVSQSHELAGTLRYMAPERFRGVSTPRCDLYALGATLYEMLTLRPPFEDQNQVELFHRIENTPPAPPRLLEPQIPRDLETIVLKALAKNPADRFATAIEMRDELRRYLEHRPIRSRPIPFYQRFWRWCQRNPWLAAANIAAAALTTTLAIVSTIAAKIYHDKNEQLSDQAHQLKLSEVDLRIKDRDSRMRLFEAQVERARAGRFSHRSGQRFDSLAALNEAARIGRELNLPGDGFDRLRDEAIACMALPDIKRAGAPITLPQDWATFASDERMSRFAIRRRDRAVLVHRMSDNQEIARFKSEGDGDIGVFSFSPGGRYLASMNGPDRPVSVWDIDRKALCLRDPGSVSGRAARFSPDSQRVAMAHDDGSLVVYDLKVGRPVKSWNGPAPAEDLAYRPDGKQVAVSYRTSPPSCHILDAETGMRLRAIPLDEVSLIAWSPDGTTLATSEGKIYLWDAATGTRKVTLEGHINGGVHVGYHPSGALLASCGWEGRTWLWDPVLGRPWLNLTGGGSNQFSPDGRIVVGAEHKLTVYQADPALEYRTLAHVSSRRVDCRSPSVRQDGRVLAVASIDGGVVLWDLARGTELAYLPIGLTWNVRFEPSGDLLTSGRALGVQRWPIQLDPDRGVFRIGPPRPLPLPRDGGISADRSGRIVALAKGDFAFVATPDGTIPIGPLNDCRGVDVSPDGQWLVTGAHPDRGGQVWRLRDATKVKDVPINGGPFSPDGKWLMTKGGRLWEVGTWREVRTIPGGQCFSPDSRLVVTVDSNRVLGLVETETGRTLARLESPDLCAVMGVTLSPDGSRLVVANGDGPAVHVWDLRAIRKTLFKMGLDWDALAYSDDDPAASSLAPLPPLQVDLGPSPLAWRPEPKFYEAFITHLEALRARQPDQRPVQGMLALYCNNYAWALVTGPESARNPQRALALARRAAELAPKEGIVLNTLGVAQYRAGQYVEAVASLEKNLAASRGELAVFNLFFQAMAHHRLGHRDEARAYYDRAVRWLSEQKGLSEQYPKELAAFRAEAEAVLAGSSREMPDNVLAEPRF
jgi:serine/threonine protein kinase/WD40 repeat protein